MARLALGKRGGGRAGVARDGAIFHQVGKRDRLGVDPSGVGLLVRERVLDLVVEQHAALRGIDEQHLAGAEAAGNQDGGGVDVEHADFARQDEPVVVGDVIARGAQAVPVDGRAGHAAVGERDRSRAVPAFGEHRLVGVPRAALVGERMGVVPRLGQQHGDRAGQAAAVHREELEHVVEHRRVGALAVQDGQHAFQLGAHDRREQVRFACVRPVHVAAQRVDLAVVDDVSVRVRAFPARRRVRGVARVNERDGRFGRGVVEVAEETAHLGGHEHALVHDGARAHRAGVEDLAGQLGRGLRRFLDDAAAHVQAPFELLTGGNVVGAAEERLLDRGHARTRRAAEVVRVGGNVAPEQQRDAAAGAAVFEDAHARRDALRVGRQKEHRHAVVAFVGQQAAVLLGDLPEEAMRDLEQDARAVAGVLLEADAAAVLKVHQHRQRVVDHAVRAVAFQVRERADAARVVFEFRPVQTGVFRHVRHCALQVAIALSV